LNKLAKEDNLLFKLNRGNLMNSGLKVKVSKYISYLLRHNPENLNLDEEGFAHIDEFLLKLRKVYNVDKRFVEEIVNCSNRKRFEIVGNKIRALYGHSINVKVELEEDRAVELLYHGTTTESARKVLRNGLRPMKRRWVHLSPTKEIAIEVGRRRALNPVVIEINANEARKNGLKFFKATGCVFLCREVPFKYLKISR
jgi:putative RNA 2'-phosphotransferase